MQIWPALDRQFTPWKNGGGETAEILCFPEGADFEGFLWRISTAKVAKDGQFSTFSGVTRSLTVIQGGPMRLCFSGHDVTLTDISPPLTFDGQADCYGKLLGAPVLDLNVMTRPPFACSVVRGAEWPAMNGTVVARLLFAGTDDAETGLSRHDLALLSPQQNWPDHSAGIIRIGIYRPDDAVNSAKD